MPYYYQQKIAERFFTYHNICHDGEKLENNKLYTPLAPQKFPTVAKDIPPYTTTSFILSGGPFYTNNLEGSAIKWGLVSNSNQYPDLDIITPRAITAISINQSTRNQFSHPFSLVIKNVYFKFRYFLTTLGTTASGVRTNQLSPSGRWIYGRKLAFIEYITKYNYFLYDFKTKYTNSAILSSYAIDLDSYNYNIVVSDNSKNVLFKDINVTSTDFVNINTQKIALSSSFISTNAIKINPFNEEMSNQDIDPNTAFGHKVRLSEKNLLVTDPLSGNGRIYVYAFNKYLTGNRILPDTILTSQFNLSGFGKVIEYKEVKNRRNNVFREVLAVSTQTQNNSSIEIFSNNFVTKIGGTNMFNLPNISLSGQRFRNVWSSKIINEEKVTGTGYYGYDIGLQVPDTTFNKTTNVLYVSEPYNNKGVVYLYGYSSRKNIWSYITSLSSASALNYGQSISVSGPYATISAPNSIVNGITGALIDVYKFSTSDSNGVSLSALSGIPLNVGSNVYGYYNLEKTDTLFIPSSANMGKHIDYNENNLTTNFQNRKTINFYGNHLTVSGDDKTEVYTRYFDKFEKNCEIDSANKTKTWENITYQISNSAVFLNAARVL
jgi:hypothetical protein